MVSGNIGTISLYLKNAYMVEGRLGNIKTRSKRPQIAT
jgi:hypothetical protein